MQLYKNKKILDIAKSIGSNKKPFRQSRKLFKRGQMPEIFE